jgi:hypothetical protein
MRFESGKDSEEVQAAVERNVLSCEARIGDADV